MPFLKPTLKYCRSSNTTSAHGLVTSRQMRTVDLSCLRWSFEFSWTSAWTSA